MLKNENTSAIKLYPMIDKDVISQNRMRKIARTEDKEENKYG